MNWSFIAGFFDGEGSITHNGTGFRISIPQTNEDVLKKICDFSRVGSIVKVTKRQAHWKDSWTYYIARQEHVSMFLKAMLPYLIVKKALTLRALNHLEKWLTEMEQKKQVYKERKSQAKLLRLKGLNYRAIGKNLNIDWGYARRLVLDLA